MIDPGDFHDALRENGFTFFAGVPDSLLKDLCAYVTDTVPEERHVISANEGTATALAAGYHLATGELPVVYLQNSGIGNVVNPLLSLLDPAVYRIPVLFLIGWRGEPGVHDEPQHVVQGTLMEELLSTLGLEYDVLAADTGDPVGLVARVRARMEQTGSSHALLVRAGTFAAHERAAATDDALPTRAEAVELVLGRLDASDVVVSTTGMTSREVYAYREDRAEGHGRDFLTVGSMGHCSQIALGVALGSASRQVVCLDGDGSVLMHMGSLAVIGTRGPRNLKHVVINNGAHDSVGGQPTAARRLDLSAVALACGYVAAETVEGVAGLGEAVARLRAADGPAMLEVKVASRARTDAGRPTSTPIENKDAFMAELRG